jgi:ankyrin repeat protein
MVKFLLAHNATVDIRRTKTLDTPLMFATASGKLTCMKLLLENGADKFQVISNYVLSISFVFSSGYLCV